MKSVVIGAGRMGRRHIQVVRSLGLELAGVMDVNPKSLAEAQAEGGLSAGQLYSDADAMLAATRPEVAVIATTAPTHCELTCRAVEAGVRYVLCEKPMATSLADCDRMMAACDGKGVKLAINHQMRFMEQYQRPKRLLLSAGYGGLTSVTVVAGNFGLAMNGTHFLEMFRFMTDEFPVSATAWFSSATVANPRGPQFQDRAGAIRLETATGKRFYLEASDDQGHGIRVIYAARNGQVVVDELSGRMETVVREEAHRALPTTRYGMGAVSEIHEIAPASVIGPSADVLRALLEGRVADSAATGRAAVAALVAAYVSHESGHCAVAIDDALPRERVFPWA